MNLVDGKIIDEPESRRVLEVLPQRICQTLSKSGGITPHQVIHACDRMVNGLDWEKYLTIMEGIGIGPARGRAYLEEARRVFSAPYLQARLEIELGGEWEPMGWQPVGGNAAVHRQLRPLGVLLHIAAGNADGLPAFSVLEGLLTGNINILKLPEVDGGISILILQELIRVDPALADYIYVFDYGSKDAESIARLVDVADGVVVWGGDPAVRALRQLVSPNTKLIEWGHKVSFAYVTRAGMEDRVELAKLARGICQSNQLLCTSCQGIYLDTGDMAEIHGFCERFLPILRQAAGEIPQEAGIGALSQVTLQVYTARLEAQERQSRIYDGDGCSVIAYGDSDLAPSLQFRNPWVKPLPREALLPTLRPHKNHLQTVALICGAHERTELQELFWRTGAVQMTDGASMSDVYCGQPHDGEYPLRRYTKVVTW